MKSNEILIIFDDRSRNIIGTTLLCNFGSKPRIEDEEQRK